MPVFQNSSQNFFQRHEHDLYVEEIALNQLATIYGTPCYVYSRKAIEQAYDAYADALKGTPGRVCFAVKANSNLAVLQVLALKGASFDIVSIGELQRVLHAGGKAEDSIFSGVGKTRDELAAALRYNIACFNVESEAELALLSSVASELGITARISLRVNPDVDANTHPYISTGLKENKFGIDIEKALQVYLQAKTLPGIDIVGLDCHIGSQLTETQPFFDALDRLLLLIDTLAEHEITIQHLDLGGGIGVQYKDEQAPDIGKYITTVKQKLGSRALELVFEPGRSIVANAGVLLTEVLYLKPTEHKNFAIIDAAMNDNIRPSLYQAWQDVQPLGKSDSDTVQTWDLVGPICETGDFLAQDRDLTLAPGDRLALMSSGAYGFVMSSNYNSRGRACEVMVDGKHHTLVRERETFDDLIRGEHLLKVDSHRQGDT